MQNDWTSESNQQREPRGSQDMHVLWTVDKHGQSSHDTNPSEVNTVTVARGQMQENP